MFQPKDMWVKRRTTKHDWNINSTWLYTTSTKNNILIQIISSLCFHLLSRHSHPYAPSYGTSGTRFSSENSFDSRGALPKSSWGRPKKDWITSLVKWLKFVRDVCEERGDVCKGIFVGWGVWKDLSEILGSWVILDDHMILGDEFGDDMSTVLFRIQQILHVVKNSCHGFDASNFAAELKCYLDWDPMFLSSPRKIKIFIVLGRRFQTGTPHLQNNSPSSDCVEIICPGARLFFLDALNVLFWICKQESLRSRVLATRWYNDNQDD